MYYTYIDGDNIGLKIEQSFLENDEFELKKINDAVTKIVSEISIYLVANNQKIIFSGADGIICKSDSIDLSSIMSYIQKIEKSITFSIGSGKSLKESYIALRYAKSIGKNIAIFLNNGAFEIKQK